MMRACLLLLLIAPSFAANESTFGLWTSAVVAQHEAKLKMHVAPDHSSRETLADYGDHRFRLLYRDADGLPEEHDKIVDVVMVHSGEGALMVGGTMSGKKGSAESGEYLGTGLAGGEVHPLGAGDIVHIPAGMPHSFRVPAGKHITYVLLKFPAQEK
ncbi:MAG TPA: AraC family ligand binding domain-containing protein [Bryobacteraceae bacterium]|nr:AraC family ligand binding domain-containing protein [Bryobacteraceae bacterium]